MSDHLEPTLCFTSAELVSRLLDPVRQLLRVASADLGLIPAMEHETGMVVNEPGHPTMGTTDPFSPSMPRPTRASSAGRGAAVLTSAEQHRESAASRLGDHVERGKTRPHTSDPTPQRSPGPGETLAHAETAFTRHRGSEAGSPRVTTDRAPEAAHDGRRHGSRDGERTGSKTILPPTEVTHDPVRVHGDIHRAVVFSSPSASQTVRTSEQRWTEPRVDVGIPASTELPQPSAAPLLTDRVEQVPTRGHGRIKIRPYASSSTSHRPLSPDEPHARAERVFTTLRSSTSHSSSAAFVETVPSLPGEGLQEPMHVNADLPRSLALPLPSASQTVRTSEQRWTEPRVDVGIPASTELPQPSAAPLLTDRVEQVPTRGHGRIKIRPYASSSTSHRPLSPDEPHARAERVFTTLRSSTSHSSSAAFVETVPSLPGEGLQEPMHVNADLPRSLALPLPSASQTVRTSEQRWTEPRVDVGIPASTELPQPSAAPLLADRVEHVPTRGHGRIKIRPYASSSTSHRPLSPDEPHARAERVFTTLRSSTSHSSSAAFVETVPSLPGEGLQEPMHVNADLPRSLALPLPSASQTVRTSEQRWTEPRVDVGIPASTELPQPSAAPLLTDRVEHSPTAIQGSRSDDAHRRFAQPFAQLSESPGSKRGVGGRSMDATHHARLPRSSTPRAMTADGRSAPDHGPDAVSPFILAVVRAEDVRRERAPTMPSWPDAPALSDASEHPLISSQSPHWWSSAPATAWTPVVQSSARTLPSFSAPTQLEPLHTPSSATLGLDSSAPIGEDLLASIIAAAARRQGIDV